MTYSREVIAELVSLAAYEKAVVQLLNGEERMALEFFIATDPERHPRIPGAGGFRKARWARAGLGKRGGVRVIYYFLAPAGRVYLAAIYAKSSQDNLTQADLRILARLANQIEAEFQRRHKE